MARLGAAPPEEAEALAAAAVIIAQRRQQDQADHGGELDRCRRDIAYWIDNYVKTFDPRLGADGKIIGTIPFMLYDFQRDTILPWLEDSYQRGEDGLIEKSRDMGATWTFLAWCVHHWLFDAGYQALLGSRKEDLVDNWEIDSLFGRAEHIVKHLPKWMLPSYKRQYLKLVNPANGNAMLGESANPDFARQGRYSVVMLDEFAFMEWGERIWTGTRDAAHVRFPISTPNGGNQFKRLRDSGKIKILTLRWNLHPKKTAEWYRQECAIRTVEDVAQELDISYNKSLRGRVYPEWDLIPKGAFPYVQGWPLYVSWDFGLDDNTALIWWARNPATGKYRVVDAYSNSGKTIDFYVPFNTGQLPSGLPYQFSDVDVTKVNEHAAFPPAVHFGDPAGKQRNQVTGSSVIDELRGQNIHIQTKPDRNTFEARFHDTKLFLRDIEGVNIERCGGLDDAISNARFPEVREASQRTTENTKPIHDWTSHFRTALEYMAVNKPAMITKPAKPTRTKSAWESY